MYKTKQKKTKSGRMYSHLLTLPVRDPSVRAELLVFMLYTFYLTFYKLQVLLL